MVPSRINFLTIVEVGMGKNSLQAALAVAEAMKKMPTGDLADLRRYDGENQLSRAFWLLRVRYLQDEIPAASDVEQLEKSWGVALAAMACLVPFGLHAKNERTGAALGRAQLSSLRLTRLLRADVEQLVPMLRQAASFLAAKGMACNVAELALLIINPSDQYLRNNIARAYYQTIDQESK